MDMSAQRLELWCLRARSKAFRDRRQHTYALKYIHAWVAAVALQSALQVSSEDFCRLKSAIKLASHIANFAQTQHQSDVLGYRALWYIRATFLLKRVGAGVRKKEQQMKVVVRRHLMMKYTQVSSSRRRRSFFTALNQWQSHVQTLKATVSKCQKLHNVIRKRAICVSWRKQVVDKAAFHDLAVNLREQQSLHEWRRLAVANYQQRLDAAELWASEQQRQSLKAWARSTLQKGGQAHSANMVRRRHERDHRNKAFHWWRHLASRLKQVEAFPDLQSPALSILINDSHTTTLKQSKWPPLSRRPDYKQEALTPIHTPSRSTGLLFPSSHARGLRFTDPVAKRGRRLENSGARKSDLWRQGLAGRELMSGHADNPMTTPKTPVPTHLRNPSRYIPALAVHQEQASLAKSTRMPPVRGQATQTSSSIAAASRSRKGNEDMEMPGLASDKIIAFI
ncbi:hypothetical protein E4U55_006304 [Claviceps digitariae]|nr:hypothetical protein E4U55_006304 [Claviceps digitariae]